MRTGWSGALVTLLVLSIFACSVDIAEARTTDRPCYDPETELSAAECSKTFVATNEPRRFKALGRAWEAYSASWVGADGREFLAFGLGSWCRDFGRYQDLRVKENACSGRLIVTVRSVGEPQLVTFEWERLDL